MKVYEVQKEYLGSYDKVEVFSSKKKAIDFILSQGECLHIVVGRGMRSPYFVYRDYVTEEKWAKLEAAGAIFLPSEVKRLGTESQGGASICHYWMTSSNSKKTGESLYLLVDSYLPQVKSASRANGFSVRLVQDVETAEPEQ